MCKSTSTIVRIRSMVWMCSLFLWRSEQSQSSTRLNRMNKIIMKMQTKIQLYKKALMTKLLIKHKMCNKLPNREINSIIIFIRKDGGTIFSPKDSIWNISVIAPSSLRRQQLTFLILRTM